MKKVKAKVMNRDNPDAIILILLKGGIWKSG